jgi:hypothetical protein
VASPRLDVTGALVEGRVHLFSSQPTAQQSSGGGTHDSVREVTKGKERISFLFFFLIDVIRRNHAANLILTVGYDMY